MASERRRACGYRKVNGLYLVTEYGAGNPCCKLPILLHVCPTCNQGVKQGRGWQWIDPRGWLKGACAARPAMLDSMAKFLPPPCPAGDPDRLGDKVGLLWIGAQFYPTWESFVEEANEMGVSRRISKVPKGFKIGEHWVFLAHPRVQEWVNPDTDKSEWIGGVFRVFRPTRIEKILNETMAKDTEAMDKLIKAGITPVIVSDNDRDHQGSVYDEDNESPNLPLGGEDHQPGAPH